MPPARGKVSVNVRGKQMQTEGCRRGDGGTDDLSRFDLPNTAGNRDAVGGGGDGVSYGISYVSCRLSGICCTREPGIPQG